MSQLPPKKDPPSNFHNWISMFGALIATLTFVCILFFIAIDLLAHGPNLYVQGVAYCFLPAVLVFGLLLIPFGAWRERSQRFKRGGATKFPALDLNIPRHRNIAFITIAVISIFTLFTLFGTYRAYEFTESVEFCGKMCHQLMEPEHTAYQKSPHARVACVQCHIGPGAGWFVRSKMSGLYQVYATITNKYPKPIETPIKNLRPAQDTCEQCHWPQSFFGAIEQDHHYFLPDEKNTPWRNRMLIFVGGGNPPFGKRAGIHWHMNIKNKIEYIATDKKRLTIPWVKKIGPGGKEEIFVAEDSGFTADKKPAGEQRRMDCIDCHNRPSHQYLDPVRSVNEAMSAGIVDPSLPYMKREAVNVLIQDYASHEDGAAKINEKLLAFYQEKYPEVFKSKREAIDKSIRAIQHIYQTNFFPAMKVTWREYPNHIGHFISPGCFRCHDGKHKNAEGKAIPNDCKVCHNIIAQGPSAAVQTAVDGLEFQHPEDIGDAWQSMSCNECHTGESVG